MQLWLGIWQRFITSLLVGNRCGCGWGLGRGLLQVYSWAFDKGLFQDYSCGTDAAEAGDLAEVYSKFISWETEAAEAGDLMEDRSS